MMKFFFRFSFILCIIIIIYSTFIFYNNCFPPKIQLKNTRDNALPHEIAIVMVNDESTLEVYKEAMETMKCYSAHYNYTYIVLNEERYPELGINCKQEDFMFRRHCVLSNFAQKYEDRIKYIVFADGDVSVINPLHRLEDYLPKNKEEIFFYDRFFNFEIMAGGYMIRNNLYGRNFLNFFADYEFKVPIKNDGSDNIALQSVFLDLLGAVKYPIEYSKCMDVYKKAVGFEQNMILVSCLRYILDFLDETPNDPDYHTFDKGKIKIIKKLSKRRWARDAWLTNWLFCDNDFFLHGWKTEEIEKYSHVYLTKFNSSIGLCKSKDFLQAWNYNMSAKVDCKDIRKILDEWINYAHDSHLKDLRSSNVSM